MALSKICFLFLSVVVIGLNASSAIASPIQNPVVVNTGSRISGAIIRSFAEPRVSQAIDERNDNEQAATNLAAPLAKQIGFIVTPQAGTKINLVGVPK